MNLLEIIVIVLIICLAVMGLKKGFVKKLASMLSLVLSIVLVSVFLPYVTDFLKERTPVYDYIVEQCRRTVAEQAAGMIAGDVQGQDSAPSREEIYRSMGREQIKALMEQNGYDSSLLDLMSDEELEQYKDQYIDQYIAQYLGDGSSGQSSAQIGRIEQTEIIEALPVPDVLKELLLDYNNSEGYRSLNVGSFQEYIIEFIATVILNVLSFVAAVIIVQLFLWVAIAALDIIAHVPVIRFVNRIAGLLLGLLQALFLIWLFFLILSMLSATDIGRNLMVMVQESEMLTYLYDSNLFLRIVLRAAAIFA